MTIKLLYVDDNPLMLEGFAALLAGSNIDLLVAENGHEGVAMATRVLPDVVLTDVRLPDIDGIEVMMRLRHNPQTAHIPVVMITGHISQRTRNYAERMGCNGYLIKPVNMPGLLTTLQPLVGEPLLIPEN
ncbi:MAG: response regulator [Chloroflexota bacterium]